MANHERYLRLARKISKEGISYSHSKRVGACVVFCDKSTSCAANNVRKSHPVVSNLNPNVFLHAEIASWLGRRWHIKERTGGKIYIYREFCNGLPALARPCDMCRKFLVERGIKTFIYTIEEYPHYRVEKAV